MKVLLIRLGQLGDVVLTTGAIEALHRKGIEVHFLTRKPFDEIFQNDYRVKRVFVEGEVSISQLRREKYDFVFDLHGKIKTFLLSRLINPFKSSTYRKYSLRRRLSLITKRPHINIPVYQMYNDALKKIGIETTQKPRLIVNGRSPIEGDYIVISPSARYESRVWRHYDKLDALLDSLPYKRVYLGMSRDLHFLKDRIPPTGGKVINLMDRTSLKEAMLIIKHARLFIGNDSGLTHIASAFDVPTVAFFGPTIPEWGFAPFASRSLVLEVKYLPCRPCSLHGEKRCARGDHACMDWLDERIAFERIKGLLEIKR